MNFNERPEALKAFFPKTLILITTYIYNEETEKILNVSIDGLKDTGFDIMVVSNSMLKPETIEKIDYFLFLKEAPFFGQGYTNIPTTNFWFGTGFFEISHWLPSYQRYGLSVLRNLFFSLDFAKSVGYDSFFYLTGDNEFGPKSLEFIRNLPQRCLLESTKTLFYINRNPNGYCDVSSVPIYSEIENFKKLILNVKTEREYQQFLEETQGNQDFMDVERFFYVNLVSKDPSLFEERNGLTQLFEDFPDTKWNQVTAVYSTDPKYKGFMTGLFSKINSEGQEIGFSVFSRNIRSDTSTREIKVCFHDGSFQMITHSLRTYEWMVNDFVGVKEISVYEFGILIFTESWDGISTLKVF